MKTSKKTQSFLLVALLLFLAVPTIALSAAQSTATLIVLDAPGGTTDVTGTTTYDDGSTITVTATPDASNVFDGWIVSSDAGDSYNTLDNPISFTASGGVTYAIQPSFSVIQPIPGRTLPPSLTTAAIVTILSSAGGTVSPAPGTYALADAGQFTLKATANSGWQFSNWIITGPNLSHGGYPYTATPTENPYTVDHGYGNTFQYQAVFTPVDSATPTPTSTGGGSTTIGASMIDIAIIVVLVVIIIALIAIIALKKKK